jgi:aldehyde dehydrogenase
MKRTPLWIGGKFLEPSGGEYFDDYNPSDQSLIAKVAKGTPEDIDTAVAAAREAFLTFSQSQAKER